MNLYKTLSIILLSLFFTFTYQHVCTDTVTQPIIVQRTIGQGSQGKAEEVLVNRKKFVLKSFLNTAQTRDNLNEAFMHKQLTIADSQKDNVVTYYMCFKKDNTYQMLMEYFSSNWENSYFKSTIRKQSEIQRAQIYKSLIQKVEFMHQQGFLHCDLKPDNIFCDINDISKFKLGDFGLSKYQQNTQQNYKCSAGSAGYVAPEISKSSIDPSDSGKYDMYAIGVMIAEIETNTSCNILDQSKQLQENQFKQQAYTQFIQYVRRCLQQNSSQQHIINDLLLGLLQRDESNRLNEQQSIQVLNQIIYNQQPVRQQKQVQQFDNFSNNFNIKPQQKYENPYGLNQPIKPNHNINMFQKKTQKIISPSKQKINNQSQGQFQQRYQVSQNNFFNIQKQKLNNQDQLRQVNQRRYSQNVYNNHQVEQQRPQQKINVQQRGISNQVIQRQQRLAQRNQSNDIWGVLQNNKKFII